MAAPVEVKTVNPHLTIDLTGTNVDVAPHDYILSYDQAKLLNGFSIITKTLTACDVTIHASNKDGAEVDVTEDFFGSGVTALAADMMYLADIRVSIKNIIVRVTPTNATNEVNLTLFAARR